jgi:hypothetical protein
MTNFLNSHDIEEAQTMLGENGIDDSFHREISDMSLSFKLFYENIS